MTPDGRAPRIVFVNRFFHPDRSATAQLLADLVFALARRGAAVEVVASRLTYDNQAALAPLERHASGVRITRVASTSFGRASTPGRLLDYASFIASARSAARRLAGPDGVVVAMTDPPLLGPALAAAAASAGARMVNWVQDLFPEVAEAAGIPGARAFRGYRDRGLARSAAQVAVGEGIARRLRAIPGVAPATVHVIPNWADGAALRPRDTRASELRSRMGLGGRFVVGYSGNLGRVHEFATVLAAAALLRDDPDIRFLFVGAGNRLAEVRRAQERERLGNLVLAPAQPRERLDDALAAADAHLCTLDPAYEGLVVPSKVYGIMAAGRACIFVGDARGEVAELVRRGGCGIAAQSGDPGALAAAIRALARSPAQAAAMGRAGRALFEAEYDLPLAVAKWEALLREVAARGPR